MFVALQIVAMTLVSAVRTGRACGSSEGVCEFVGRALTPALSAGRGSSWCCRWPLLLRTLTPASPGGRGSSLVLPAAAVVVPAAVAALFADTLSEAALYWGRHAQVTVNLSTELRAGWRLTAGESLRRWAVFG